MKAIKTIREALGLSQAKLAEKVGVTQTAIARYENGDRLPGIQIAFKIANTLNCTIDDLMKD